jgi:hypothetical protein
VKEMRTDEHGDDWIAFSSGASMIETRLRYSAGRAEATLRGLCAGGEVRSLRTKFTYILQDGEPERVPESSTFIRPSEWRTTEVDFEGDIDVSQEDLVYWFGQQGSALAPDLKDAAIERQLALKPRPIWKVIGPAVRAECGKTEGDRGWSDVRIKARGLELLRQRAGHSD